MKWVLLAMLLGSSLVARADGLDAATLGAVDAQPLATLGRFVTLSGGVKGLNLIASNSSWPRSFFAYANVDWSATSIEAGGGMRLDLIGPLKGFVGAGGILVPRFGVSGGGRVLAGLSARFGEQLFFAPALSASFGAVSPEPVTLLLPFEGSAQVGYAWRYVSVFLRFALGADPLAGPMTSLRADAALGLSVAVWETED